MLYAWNGFRFFLEFLMLYQIYWLKRFNDFFKAKKGHKRALKINRKRKTPFRKRGLMSKCPKYPLISARRFISSNCPTFCLSIADLLIQKLTKMKLRTKTVLTKKVGQGWNWRLKIRSDGVSALMKKVIWVYYWMVDEGILAFLFELKSSFLSNELSLWFQVEAWGLWN